MLSAYYPRHLYIDILSLQYQLTTQRQYVFMEHSLCIYIYIIKTSLFLRIPHTEHQKIFVLEVIHGDRVLVVEHLAHVR